jgi:hypothetical protein
MELRNSPGVVHAHRCVACVGQHGDGEVLSGIEDEDGATAY